MDKIPTSAGGAPDGAFERFLTAAIATIITIMFSWRLLAEEEEASGGTGATPGLNTTLHFSVGNQSSAHNTAVGIPKFTKTRLTDIRDIDLSLDEGSVSTSQSPNLEQTVQDDVVYDRHDPVQEHPFEAIPVAQNSSLSISNADDNLTDDTLTTWDEYKWEEETGEEEPCVIKTRRNVRDFITNPSKSLNLLDQNQSEVLEPQSLSFGASPENNNSISASVPFSQRFANFEYKDVGGDSGYIDLYPDIESDDTDSDTSEDEHVYEIQVSDSDSESDDEDDDDDVDRGGAVFGVTSLDTIMEEYESDVSERGEECRDANAREGCGHEDSDTCKWCMKSSDKSLKPCDNVCDIKNACKQPDQSGMKDTNLITSETLQNVAVNDHKTYHITESRMLRNKLEINVNCRPQQSDTPLRSSEAGALQYNLLLGKTSTEDVTFTTCSDAQSEVSPTVPESDLNINQQCVAIFTPKDNHADDEKCLIYEEIYQTASKSQLNKLKENPKDILKLNLSGDDYEYIISDLSDESLPSSPVRTCALDNLTEEQFSDTESCSSESVITVISVKSNDSDSYSDKHDNISYPSSISLVIKTDPAPSTKDLSSLINDQTSEGLGKYETYSLVSGFLNDSLNSLLSANTGSIENDSEGTDAESSSEKEYFEQENENQLYGTKMNGKITSDDSALSSVESLPTANEVTQINTHITENGCTDSADSLNIASDPTLNEQHLHEQPADEQHVNTEYHYSDSDNSSDSSDPPLREYDPDDDDLAAFQFNLDSDDDSFFLVIGDENDEKEGMLRNFDTFTNLNSVGLSPEYGDAFTSHTLPDDARGFKFSHTEDISTHFKKRLYLTDRCNLSDSETRSDGPLSPITSEDEDIKSEETNEKPIMESVNQHAPPSTLPSISSYADAELSTTEYVNEIKSNKICSNEQIDFNKYIIHTELSPISENVPFPEEAGSPTVDKDINQINTTILLQYVDQKSVIDSTGDKTGTLGVKEMNNLPSDGHEDTFSSLTEKIQGLTHTGTSHVENSDNKSSNSVNEIDLDIGLKVTYRNDKPEQEPVVDNQNIINENVSYANCVKSKETLIDDVLNDAPSSKYSESTAARINSGRDRNIETNIDDFFESEVENYVPKSKPCSKIETNIDDIFSTESNDELNKSNDSLTGNRKRYNVRVTHSKSKIETNIDDIFYENIHVATTVPVHSTPLKSEWKSTRETNIDNIFNDETAVQNGSSALTAKQNDSVETSVDDLFDDLDLVTGHENSSIKDSKQEECFGNKVKDRLSYETFVDDLFGDILPPKSSQTHAHIAGRAGGLTSESAINIEQSTEAPSSASTRQLNEITREIHPGGVQAVNEPVQICTDLNNTQTLNVKDNLQRTNDPQQTDIIHDEKIANIDNDGDNSLDTIEPFTKEYKRKTAPPRYEFGTNYRQIFEEPEKSNTYQNPKDLEDNGLTYDRYVENRNKQKQKKSLNTTECIGTITTQNNYGINNRHSLDNNSNTPQLDFKDHNANISLPKAQNLNNVKKNTRIGHSPDKDNRYTSKHSGISLVAEPYSDNSQYNVENISQTGLQLDHNLLKSEEECAISDVELKIVEDADNVNSEIDLFEDGNLDSIGSCSLLSDDESLNSLEESFHSLQDSYNSTRLRGLSDSALTSRIIRTPATKPSDFFSKSKDLKGVKKKVYRHNLKKYTSILQQPVTPERANITFDSPLRPPSVSRLKVLKSRERFLSAENLSAGTFEDKFLQHRTSLASTPRKYLKRHESLLQSTESLPCDMTAWNSSYGSHTSMGKLHSRPSPRNIEDLYSSRYSSANSSYEKADYDKLHANCMFSPAKREEIRHTTKSLENMFEQLLRYGSVSSLATETDLDADVTDDVNARGQSLHDTYYISFQYPLERAASMSAITGPSASHRLPRKPGKGRFASRNVPKSKSLQTLETNLDDVFTDESNEPGKLSRTPSEHELRVSKSLSKLHIPDWFKRSSFSRSGSTQSLFTYARTASTSTIGSSVYPPSLTTSPSPSVTPGSNAVIIQKRVTPTTNMTPSARLLRAPMLPTTPEKAPIHNTSHSLPSDRYRKTDKKETLKPIAIVPFAKLREMFEKKSQKDTTKPPASSPTKEKPSAKVRFEPVSPSKETVIDSSFSDPKPVQNNRTMSPPPPVPERKPILTDHGVKHIESSAPNARRTQVHFSDENHVSRSQEQNTNSVRHNGTASSTSSSTSSGTVKKPQSFRASLPLPQFRFRRPGIFAKQATAASKNSSSQSKQGKEISRSDNFEVNEELAVNSSPWMHALELKTKTDGEILFEFLQKRRYSSILENGFAEQLDELQDKGITFNFPVMTLGRHSNYNGDLSLDGSTDLQIILTNARANNGYIQSKLHSDTSVDDILDGLLLLDGHRTGRMRIDENGRIVARTAVDLTLSPDTPPGLSLKLNSCEYDPSVYRDCNGSAYDEEICMDYVLVKCENPECKRETNLREAKQCYKSCHSCFTYYCSRTCRKLDWEAHKQVCIYSRINSACKHAIKYINRQPHLQYQCSRIARRGYLSQGRGCVVFAFPDISSSEDFLLYGMESLWVPPVYISLKELPHATMLGTNLGILTDTCKQYNPELKYVIHVAIVIPPKLPMRPVPRRMESIIQKCAKLRLSPAHMHPKQDDADTPSTLILTAVPGNQHADESDDRKTRELCFVNIQRKLRNRGVSLRHQFPEVYNKLIDFVSDAKHFSPQIIYPSDNRTGRRFMCVIMPEAEPEIEWIRDPDLFHELDVFDDEGTDVSTLNLSILQQPEIML